MLMLFASTLFVSSALLFVMQPMFAKMVLPMLGGTPAVWNTCVVFFQATLLAGYAYSHITTARLAIRWQIILQAVLLLIALLALPIRLGPSWTPPTDHNPILWLIRVLVVSVGLPFFVVSTTAPLLQNGFQRQATGPQAIPTSSMRPATLAVSSRSCRIPCSANRRFDCANRVRGGPWAMARWQC
jgi:hypothetical protein